MVVSFPKATPPRVDMRILLIAYEFPPIPSPQSIRWAYLTRELAGLGVDVHVLAPDHPGYGPSHGLPRLPAGVSVHRTFPGPFGWLLRKLARRRLVGGSTCEEADPSPSPIQPPKPQAALNWKGRVLLALQAAAGWLVFPDVRGEWNPWAKAGLHRLLDSIKPDLVISSHEPASTLELGLLAVDRGYRWFADLGDPVVASYTPQRWRRRALALERKVCLTAERVVVTTSATKTELLSRHGGPPDRFIVLSQGFDNQARTVRKSNGMFEREKLELLYCGSFYGFRRPDALLAALSRLPGIRLSIAASTVPSNVLEASLRTPDSVRLLGYLPHSEVLELQRSADVLINISNDDPVQVPGKLYEYLGAGRPILQVGGFPLGEAGRLLELTGSGWNCGNSEEAVVKALQDLEQRKSSYGESFGLSIHHDAVDGYSWNSLARVLLRTIDATNAGTVRDSQT